MSNYKLNLEQLNYVAAHLRPVHVYFLTKDPQKIFANDDKIAFSTLQRKIVFATNWGEMAELFKQKPESLCINADGLNETSLFELVNMVDTFAKLVGIEKEISISLAVYKHTPHSLIKEAQKTRVIGIVPAHEEFGTFECVKGLQAQWNNIPYWPKHILDELLGVKKKKPESISSTKNVVLTPRQKQIFEIVTTRGCSNKQVAKLLNLSESTIKLHMSAIFKKYGVKNRTQLAVFSKV